MTHRLTTNYAKNYCNRTLIVKVIVENVVTCFFGDTVYVPSIVCSIHFSLDYSEHISSYRMIVHVIVLISNFARITLERRNHILPLQ